MQVLLLGAGICGGAALTALAAAGVAAGRGRACHILPRHHSYIRRACHMLPRHHSYIRMACRMLPRHNSNIRRACHILPCHHSYITPSSLELNGIT